MTPDPRPHVSRAAHLLGYAGLLPQVAAVALIAAGAAHHLGEALAFGYGSLILSFLGGIWWGLAMRRRQGQTMLAALAVVPSLAVLALGVLIVAGGFGAALVGLGVAIMGTLLVDRRLVATGDVPPDWMSLRIPLSLGLGGLTILAGLLAR